MRLLPPICALLAALVPAQSGPLTLSGEAGSFPGPLRLEMSPGKVGLAGALFLSPSAGPTPLRFVNPGDQRVLDVGLVGAITLQGIFLPPGVMTFPAAQIPNDPSYLDVPIYLQGLVLFENPPQIVGRISQPQPMRLAPAGKFRDRNTQFTTPRAFFPVIERADRRPMLLGGGSGALLAQIATKQTESYDPVTDSFSAGPDMTTERSLHTATRLGDGRWLIVGGVDVRNDPQDTAEIYDPVQDTFSAVAPMAVKRMGHAANLLPDGRVLVTGGLTTVNSQDVLGSIASSQSSTEIYDPARNVWTKGPDMNLPRAGHGAIPLPSGKLLMAGGLGWIKIIITIPQIWKECELYDPASNRFTSSASMSTGHAIFSVNELGGGKYLLAGGAGTITLTNLNGKPTDVAELYDANSDSWSPAGKLARARAMHTGFPVHGEILVIGGADGGLTNPIALGTTEIYDPKTNAWRAGPPMSASRTGYGSYVNPIGQIHLLGGGSGPSATVNNTTDWYYR